MPEKKKRSILTKLLGFAIVVAVIAFGAKSQLPIYNQLTHQQTQGAQLPDFVVPVDRSLLSQQLLPALSGFKSMEEIEESFYANTPQDLEAGADLNQNDSPVGPSLYQLKLEDQKAWSCQPRRASLLSLTKRPAESSQTVSFATSQSPIVPGYQDPHRWYESQFLELAASHDDQWQEPIESEDQIEFKALPNLMDDVSAIEPLSAPPRSVALVAAVAEQEPSAKARKADPVRTVGTDRTNRTARAWETGRY